MRSQAPKPVPKKGELSKTSFKPSTTKQAAKKSVSPKKIKNLVNKSLIKSPKKNTPKDDPASPKNDEEPADKNEPVSETNKAGPSKAAISRGDSPTKKPKKPQDPKEKKDPTKVGDNLKKTPPKKAAKTEKKPKPVKCNVKKNGKDNKDTKYKINKDNILKKATPKFSKAKNVIKKGPVATNNDKKKGTIQQRQETDSAEKEQKEEDKDVSTENSKACEEGKPTTTDNNEDSKTSTSDPIIEDKTEPRPNTELGLCKTPPKPTSTNQPETPKTENERPPKFFTSTRSPRTVDIDVKCCKNSKGNLSVSERFLSMKLETKAEDTKDKNNTNTLVSQGPEIDVYTFTEKVDSPKSILSDFRSPINKNIGRVRPIARVKGTVIDKKGDSERKKYSPHRPIEEVVKQLKNKRSEELNANQSQTAAETVLQDTTETEEKPKPIVSKSYKMVARKSSITGKPFSPLKFFDAEPTAGKSEKSEKSSKPNPAAKKNPAISKTQYKKPSLSDEDIDNSKFALNTKTFHYTSSDESVGESNDDNDTKESSESDNPKAKKTKNRKLKKNRIIDGAKKTTSKELKELSKDSLIDLKESSALLGNEKPSKRRLKLLSMWSGPKKHRMASLNAIAKVHCLYENESRTHMELGLMKTVDRQPVPSTSKTVSPKKKENKPKETEKPKEQESTSESEYEAKKEKKEYSSESSDDNNPPQRSLRGVPGIRSAGKYWDPKSSTSSSEDSEMETKKKTTPEKKKATAKASSSKSDSDKPPAKMKKTAGVPVKKKRNRNEVVMDLKDMVVQKRMASLNATAILAASYEKRSPKSNKDDTTSDSCSDESFSHKPKNGVNSGVKSESKNEYETKTESDESALCDRKQKVEVIVNQDTDLTITGVYQTHHHEGFCTVSGMQYRISSTSHTQTTATANCDKEGCSREDGARYTPLSALSSMQPPADHAHSHSHSAVPELGGLARRPGCSSAFSAPSTASHHEPEEDNNKRQIESDCYTNNKVLTKEEEQYEGDYITTTRDETGRYEVHLPFNKDIEKIVNLYEDTKEEAIKLTQLEKRFSKDEYSRKYKKIIHEDLTFDHIKKTDIGKKINSINVPCHTVARKERETNEVSVLFDETTRRRKVMKIGPTLQYVPKELFTHWAAHKILIKDFDKMDRLVKTTVKQFYFRDFTGDKIESYKLQSDIFCSAAAPYETIHKLKQLAEHEVELFPIEAAVIKTSCYTENDRWKHVQSVDNSGDLASRRETPN